MIGVRRTAVLGGALALTVGLAPAALAGDDRGVERRGPCSGTSDWKLKAKPDNGRIEVEFEVDSNRVGQTWNVRLRDDGTLFFRGTRTTRPPSGSFEVRAFTRNRPGADVIVGRAVNPATGEVCRGSVTL